VEALSGGPKGRRFWIWEAPDRPAVAAMRHGPPATSGPPATGVLAIGDGVG
jgi:hypothetical protein